MSSREFRDRLTRRAQGAGVHIDPEILDALEAYVRLLSRWNEKINLTALSLRYPNDETFDRLLIEPLAAVRLVDHSPVVWFDLGSGCGSPAIPLKLARPELRLTMVESKVRKAAFLREAVRTLGLPESNVENVRFEELTENTSLAGSAKLVTVRAVRVDATLFDVSRRLLCPGGRLLLFGFGSESSRIIGFDAPERIHLIETSQTHVAVFRRAFHVEQRR